MNRSALALLLASLLGACPGLRFGPEGQITDASYLLKRLDARAQKIRSLKGEAGLKVTTPGQSGPGGLFVAAQRPGSLHLETLSFFGKPVAALATDGSAFHLFVEEGATFYSGPATAANLRRLLPLALSPEEAVSLLLSDVPRLAGAEARLELDTRARAYLLTLSRGEARQQIWASTLDQRPLRSRLRGREGGYDVAFSDWQVVEGVLFPMAIEIEAVLPDGTGAGTELSLRYKEDLELNVALDPRLFSLAPPPGTRHVRLDAQGREVPPAP